MNVLFICTGNTCRSPMAAALLEKMAKEEGWDIDINSAGILAQDGQEASRGAIDALKLEGIDIEDSYQARMVSVDLLKQADLILTMGASHRDALIAGFDFIEDKIYTLKKYAYNIEGDIKDPFASSLTTYIRTKEEIKKALKKINWKDEIDENRNS